MRVYISTYPVPHSTSEKKLFLKIKEMAGYICVVKPIEGVLKILKIYQSGAALWIAPGWVGGVYFKYPCKKTLFIQMDVG